MKLSSFVRKVLNDASLHLFLIVLIGFIIYSKTFNVPFHFDDTPNIVENYKLRDLNNFWPPSGSRWFGCLTFALNYKLGGLNVTGYHIVNLVIHILNAILVYWLVALTFRTPYFSKIAQSPHPPFSKGGQGGILIALFSALIFVSHPIQTQAVTYIVQRFASLATFFYLLSLVMYVKYRIQDTEVRRQNTEVRIQNTEVRRQNTEVRIQNTDDKTSCHSCESRNPETKDWIPVSTGMTDMSGKRLHKILSLKSVFWYLGSVFSAILAMKTKEISFTLPFIILLYEFCFFKSQNYELRTMNLRRLLYLIPFLLTLLIIPPSMLEIEKPLGEVIHDVSRVTRVEMDGIKISRPDYLFTQCRVIVAYIRLIFFPVNQTLDYYYPIYHSFLNPNVFLSFLFLLSIFGLAIYLLYCSRSQVYGSLTCHPEPKAKGLRDSSATLQNDSQSPTRLIAFGIFWFFITLSVESSIIPIVHVIFEHRVYLPSVGVLIALTSSLFFAVQKWQGIKKPVLISLAIIVVIFGGASYARNKIWGNAILLWEDGVRKAPQRVAPYYHLGVAYYEAGRLGEAIQAFNLASILGSDYPEIYFRKGLAYEKMGWLDDAIQAYETALRLRPGYKEAQYNLSVVYSIKRAIEGDNPKTEIEK